MISHMLPTPPGHSITNIPHQSSTFVTMDGPTLTHHNQPKFTVQPQNSLLVCTPWALEPGTLALSAFPFSSQALSEHPLHAKLGPPCSVGRGRRAEDPVGACSGGRARAALGPCVPLSLTTLSRVDEGVACSKVL